MTQLGELQAQEGAPSPRLRPRPLFVVLGLAPAAALVAYVLLQGRPGGAAAYAITAFLSIVAFAVAIRLNRPARSLGWKLLLAGLATWFLGDLVWGAYDLAGLPFPFAGDAIYLMAYPFIAAGALVLTTRGRTGFVGGLLDSGVFAICGGLFIWSAVLEGPAQHGAPVSAHVVAAVYPTAAILILTAFGQLLAGRTVRRSPALHLAFFAALAAFAGDVIYGAESLRGEYGATSTANLAWLAGYVLFAWAALHPSARDVQPGEDRVETTNARLAMLALVCLLAPAALLVQASHGSVHLEVFAVWGSVLVVLVFWRMALLFRQHRRGEAALAAVFQHSLDGMLVADDNRVYVDANEAVCRILGLSRHEILGRRMEDVLGNDPAQVEEAWRLFLASGELRGEWPATRPDGTTILLEFSARANFVPGRHLSILRDVTQRHQLEDRLRQSQKLEAIGQLAGGVAHDFNNLLTAIGGYSRLALADVEGTNERAASRIREIERASGRAADLTRQLLAFGRRQMLQPVVFDLNDAVAETESMLRRLLGEHIRIVTSLAPGGSPIEADRGQIEQVLVNLAVNARDAMPAGGTLAIETENVAERVVLRVTDTGVGMDEATRAQAFEPFFTTKGTGEGTGLGLATVHGIVHQSGGEISVWSEPGSGATFEISLARSSFRDAVPHSEPGEVGGGNERILLVEDEAVVRDLASEMLRERGYDVLCAQDPEEALVVAARGPIDVLVTDMVMPKMSGRALAGRLRERQPRLPIVYTSGYSDDAALRDGELETGAVFLQKPFGANDLGRAVRDVLAGERSRNLGCSAGSAV